LPPVDARACTPPHRSHMSALHRPPTHPSAHPPRPAVPARPPDHRPDRSTPPHIAHPSPARPAPTPRPPDPPRTLDPPANFTPAPAPRNRSWSKSRSDGPNNPPVRTPSATADPLTRPRFVRTALTPPHARVLAPHQSVGIHRPRHPTNSPAHRVQPPRTPLPNSHTHRHQSDTTAPPLPLTRSLVPPVRSFPNQRCPPGRNHGAKNVLFAALSRMRLVQGELARAPWRIVLILQQRRDRPRPRVPTRPQYLYTSAAASAATRCGLLCGHPQLFHDLALSTAHRTGGIRAISRSFLTIHCVTVSSCWQPPP
jgi:hypothetical protein